MSHRQKRKFSFFLWHRRAGLTALVLIILLAITGILLNHTKEFNLDSRFVDSSLILNWYGLEPDGDAITYQLGDHKISQWGQQVFFDNRPVTSTQQTLRGSVKSERFIVVAFDTELLLLTETGELIERIPTGSSFTNIQRLGIKYSRSIIETSDPLYYMADEHIMDWDVTTDDGITWSTSVTLSQAQREELRHAYRGQGLSLERVLLDLHSGRIFGEYGIYIMDAVAIAMIWLSLSGFWVWLSRSRKQKKKKHYMKHHRKIMKNE